MRVLEKSRGWWVSLPTWSSCFLSWPVPVFAGRVPPCYFPPTTPGSCWPPGHHPATEFSLQSCLGMEPHTRQRESETEASARHAQVREACKTSYRCLRLCAVRGGVAFLIPLFFCCQERGPSPAAHLLPPACQQQSRTESGENTLILVCDNHPVGGAGVSVASGVHCFVQPLSLFLDVP